MSRLDPQINIRLPADLLARTEADAEANRRSLTAEIVARLSGTQANLRDQIAMAALVALLTSPRDPVGEPTAPNFAYLAYAQADAMLAERAKGGA